MATLIETLQQEPHLRIDNFWVVSRSEKNKLAVVPKSKDNPVDKDQWIYSVPVDNIKTAYNYFFSRKAETEFDGSLTADEMIANEIRTWLWNKIHEEQLCPWPKIVLLELEGIPNTSSDPLLKLLEESEYAYQIVLPSSIKEREEYLSWISYINPSYIVITSPAVGNYLGETSKVVNARVYYWHGYPWICLPPNSDKVWLKEKIENCRKKWKV